MRRRWLNRPQIRVPPNLQIRPYLTGKDPNELHELPLKAHCQVQPHENRGLFIKYTGSVQGQCDSVHTGEVHQEAEVQQAAGAQSADRVLGEVWRERDADKGAAGVGREVV